MSQSASRSFSSLCKMDHRTGHSSCLGSAPPKALSRPKHARRTGQEALTGLGIVLHDSRFVRRGSSLSSSVYDQKKTKSDVSEVKTNKRSEARTPQRLMPASQPTIISIVPAASPETGVIVTSGDPLCRLSQGTLRRPFASDRNGRTWQVRKCESKGRDDGIIILGTWWTVPPEE